MAVSERILTLPPAPNLSMASLDAMVKAMVKQGQSNPTAQQQQPPQAQPRSSSQHLIDLQG